MSLPERNSMSNVENETLKSVSEISFEVFLSNADPLLIKRETFLVPVDRIVLAENIRPFDQSFIEVLKANIKEQGQLQECIGDIIVDEDGLYKVRVIAGQHRTIAITQINEEGTRLPVRVSVADRMLDTEMIIGIQMSENLQNKMTPAQDAYIIHNFWERLKKLREEEGKKLTIVELARKVGRSVDTVSNAIRYIEGIHPLVQRLVDEKKLPYTQALSLSSIEKGNGYESKQLDYALLFIAKGFTFQEAKKYLEGLKAEDGFVGPLFGDEEWKGMERDNRTIAIRSQADREGKSATGWFVRMIQVAKILPNSEKVKVSNAIKRAVGDLGLSLEDFKSAIKPFITEDEYNEVFKV